MREHEALQTEWNDVLMVDYSDGAALSYPMLVKELFDYANSSSAEEFVIFSKDLLAGLEKQPTPMTDGSAGAEQEEEAAAKFTAPSQLLTSSPSALALCSTLLLFLSFTLSLRYSSPFQL